MNKVNSLVICRDNYKTNEEFKNVIRDSIMILLKNNYIITVRYDEKELGIVCIDYNYSDPGFGCPYPYWLNPEQVENII